ncbi:MAG: FtsQ-type POTRA domain-containing protein, partial [Caulobacterales bacterium]|nr:FtsQ-type POTRA domain-containing protein [Caulobacterales bacterium]
MSEVRTTRAQTAKKRRRRRPSTPTDVLRDNARAHAADQLRKARERRRRSTGKRRAAQFALAVTAVLGFTFYLGGFFELAARNLDEAARAKLVEAGFVLRHVDVHGAERASSDDIARALMLEPGELLFELDPAAARRSLLTMPLVRDATVIRLYPNRVAVIVD